MGYITLLGDLPLVWNLIMGVVIMMIYIQGTIKVMEKLVDAGTLSSDLSRKVIHIAAGSYIWVWLFIDSSDMFSAMFNVAVPLLFFATFLLKGFKATSDDKDVKTMTRTGDPKELLKGPLYFTIVMMVAGTLFLDTWVGVFMMAIVGWGDGIAPYIGKKYGGRTYKTFGSEKTFTGSIGVFVFSVAGCLVFYALLGVIGGLGDQSLLPDPGIDLVQMFMVIVILGLVAMIVEAFSPSDIDNLLLPASTIVVMFLLNIVLEGNFFGIFF
ncbi:phosphatidate cytidylyltransferase [Candidatus Heimdallarchaeota archaeon B3_Heim]|nr:MAG: phosphatidate cytidylyltransferase [Candidatus Heimdallarchaeota archaeon B3_Heim]